jgi:hypothetical protein
MPITPIVPQWRRLDPSEDLLQSADTEVTVTSSSYILKKQIQITTGVIATSIIRIKLDFKGPGIGKYLYIEIRKNGTEVLYYNTRQIDVYDTITTDEGPGWNMYDTIDLYAKVTAGETAFLKNFRIYGTDCGFLVVKDT